MKPLLVRWFVRLFPILVPMCGCVHMEAKDRGVYAPETRFVWSDATLTLPELTVTPRCVSTYGMVLNGSDDCNGFRLIEARAVTGFVRAGLFTRVEVAQRLHGVAVIIRPDAVNGIFPAPGYPQGVFGITNCENTVVELGSDNWKTSAFTHELAHVLQPNNCMTDAHENWSTNGICAGVNKGQPEGPGGCP